MEVNKILFVGLGGAGQRHLRIFRDLLPPETEFSAFRAVKKTPLLKSDFSIDMDSTVEKQFDLKLFNSLERAFDNAPDLVVISTPTSLHYEVARRAAEKGIDIFIEKPFSHNLNGFDKFKDIVLKNNLICFISFQRRFHPYLSKIKELIETEKLGKIITVNFNVGSYVPAWHPYEDFKELYACRSDLGGGVLLTEIHEIDLCYWYFGLPDYVYCAGGNYSDVKLDVEDTIHLTLKYNNFAVQVNLCFMQKHNRRDLYIAGMKGYVEWSMEGNKLILNNYSKSKKKILADPEFTNDAMFYSQNSYFLNKLNRSDNKTYIEIARASLAIVEAAKESITKGVDVKVLRGQ